jgi:hypothetical protein
MAQTAILRKACGRVVWIGRAVEICQMAGRTRGRESGEHIVFVTLPALQRHVSAGQGELRQAVIEFGVMPGIELMACITGDRDIGCHMIWNLGSLIVLEVTRYTRCAQPRELADRFSLMTGLAINSCMSAHQREPVLMSFYGLQGYIPAPDRMAFFTLSTKLTAMYVRMTIGTPNPRFRKNEVFVARATRNARMHSAQGEVGFVVVEIRVGTNRAPAGRGVAIFTGERESTVRVSRASLNGLREGGLRAEPGQKQ